MTDDGRPSLFRLTKVADDPAVKWLSGPSRVVAAAAGLAVWLAWSACFVPGLLLYLRVRGDFSPADVRPGPILGSLAFIVGALLVISTVSWVAVEARSRTVLGLVRKTALARALPLDDWSKLAGAPDDRPLSLVGRVRGRSHLRDLVDGKQSVGVTLGCRAQISTTWVVRNRYLEGASVYEYSRRCSEFVEVLYDFDLVDDQGQVVPILVAGGRLIGRRNVGVLGDDQEEINLIASLLLPPEVKVLGRRAFVLRDGDPVMVIGFKSTLMDPGDLGALASAPPIPLLVYGLRAENQVALAPGG
jgi:hypothetical protein